jgi:glycosyltransferase involved in cell wall biosynthesis
MTSSAIEHRSFRLLRERIGSELRLMPATKSPLANRAAVNGASGERFQPWHVLHVDLSRGVPTLPGIAPAAGFYVVFWWGDLPLGHRQIPAGDLPITPLRSAELAAEAIAPAVGDHLDRLAPTEEPLRQLAEVSSTAATAAPSLPVSVVVCTRDRTDSLARCLRSILELSQSPVEVLVVDNAPGSEATRELVSRMPGMRYVREERPGLDVARNAAIRSSTGAVIAFTDDDATVHRNWTVQLQKAFRRPAVMAVTGLVLPAELETEAQCIFEEHWGFNRGYRRRVFDGDFLARTLGRGAPVWQIGAGANMALRREAFDRVGGFDERLDAGAAGCSGDSELWYRLLAAGHECAYEPTAVVFHRHRREMKALQRQIFAYMRGSVTAHFIQFERHRHWGNLRRVFLAFPAVYARLLLSGGLRGFRSRHRTLGMEIAGYLSGLGFYLRHRERRGAIAASHTDSCKTRYPLPSSP